jgi:hypothetical protein
LEFFAEQGLLFVFLSLLVCTIGGKLSPNGKFARVAFVTPYYCIMISVHFYAYKDSSTCEALVLGSVMIESDIYLLHAIRHVIKIKGVLQQVDNFTLSQFHTCQYQGL